MLYEIKRHVSGSMWVIPVIMSNTGCAKKKKDILNIYVKSQIINIFF